MVDFPLLWGDPSVQELRDVLASAVYRERDIEFIVTAAGVPPASVPWQSGLPARSLWFEVMNEAAGVGRLVDLVQLAAVGAGPR